jgi:hypothetical protein
MADPILKKHGGIATGTIAKEPDGRFRASLLIRNLEKEIQQMRGPEFLGSERAARDWVIRQAGLHGFGPNEFDVMVEEDN